MLPLEMSADLEQSVVVYNGVALELSNGVRALPFNELSL